MRWPVLFLLSALVAATLGVPVGMVVYWLLHHAQAATSPVAPSLPEILAATLNSIGYGLAGAAAALVIAAPIGYLAVRYPGRWTALIERAAYLALGAPGIVVALALISLTIQLAPPLYQSLPLLALAYAILFLPLALVSIRAALSQIPQRFEEVARSLGGNGLSVAIRVVLPLAASGIGAGAAMVFIFVSTELTATLLLAPAGAANAGDGSLGEHVVARLRRGRAVCRPDPLPVVRLHVALRQPARQGGFRRLELTMARLSVTQLTKTFDGKPVLRGVDLDVSAGSLVAVLGSSGSGKTTLLRLICGFERADSGAIEIDGQVVSGAGVHAPPERRRIGYVAQEGSLFPHLTVFDNVAFGLSRSERRDRARIEALLASVGLPAAYAGRAPHQLSGGEQQRVALARALAPAPKLVLLDEPFSSLDAALRVETRQAVAAALAASGATALLVTHDQSEALAMGAEVAVLRGGVVAQIATPEMLYRQPVDVAMARFVGEAVILRGTVLEGASDLRARAPAARAPGPGRTCRCDGAARADSLRRDAERGDAARAGRRGHLLRTGRKRVSRPGRAPGDDRKPRPGPSRAETGRRGSPQRRGRRDGLSARRVRPRTRRAPIRAPTRRFSASPMSVAALGIEENLP